MTSSHRHSQFLPSGILWQAAPKNPVQNYPLHFTKPEDKNLAVNLLPWCVFLSCYFTSLKYEDSFLLWSSFSFTLLASRGQIFVRYMRYQCSRAIGVDHRRMWQVCEG